MYDISTENVKKGKKFYFIFLAVGLLLLIIMGGVLVYSYIKLKSLDSTTTSTNVIVNSHVDDEGSTLYSPTYYYVVNGREYSCSSNSSSSINPGTDNKTVYYDSKNPSNCMTEYSKSSNNLLLIFTLLPLIIVAVAVINMKKISKRLKLINELNQKGKLVKNLPYHLENTGISVNNIPVQRPVVEYTLSSGSTITLYGDPRHDFKTTDADEMVDLVIDESNPDNYFIDFEINRLSGNLPSDYSNNISSNEVQPNNVNYQINNQEQIPQNNQLNQNNNYNTYSNPQQNQVLPQNNYPQANLNQVMNQQPYPNQNQVLPQNNYPQANSNQVMNQQPYPNQNNNIQNNNQM